MRERIKYWNRDNFSLTLWDTNRRDHLGKSILAYRFRDKGKTIFEGEDFACSPMHAIDSMHAVYSLLSFLTLGKGDTDAEYFDHYTPEQLAWRDSHRREELNMLVIGGEERLEKRRR